MDRESLSRTATVPWLVGLLVLQILPFLHRGALIGGDEPHYALMAHSLAVGGGFDLSDEYVRVEQGSDAAGRKRAGKAIARHVRSIGAADVFTHPVGMPLIAAPFLALQMKLMPGVPPDYLLILLTLCVTTTALVVGWGLLNTVLKDARRAGLAVACIYFASPLWYYSRTYFTEPWTWSLAILAIGAVRHRAFLLGGVLLGLAIAVKETSLLIVVPILLVSVRRFGRRAAVSLCVGPTLWIAFFMWKNVVLVGAPLSTFQKYEIGDPLEGAIGLVFDPAHGLLWFAPLILVGGVCLIRRGTVPSDIRLASLVAFGAYFVMTAAWVDWRGGSCYATRLLLPVLPALGLGVANQMPKLVDGGVLPVLFVLGFLPNWCAVNNPFFAFWGVSAYELIVTHPAWASAGLVVGPGLFILVRTRYPRTENVELQEE